MEHFSGFEQPPTCGCPHSKRIAIGNDERFPQDKDLEGACQDALTGGLPRMFALVQEFGEDDEIVTEVVAYGLALPDGGAATVGVTISGFGRWISAHSAASRLHSDLVWLGEGHA